MPRNLFCLCKHVRLRLGPIDWPMARGLCGEEGTKGAPRIIGMHSGKRRCARRIAHSSLLVLVAARAVCWPDSFIRLHLNDYHYAPNTTTGRWLCLSVIGPTKMRACARPPLLIHLLWQRNSRVSTLPKRCWPPEHSINRTPRRKAPSLARRKHREILEHSLAE